MLVRGGQIDVKMARPAPDKKEGEEKLTLKSNLTWLHLFESRKINSLGGFHEPAVIGVALDVAYRPIFLVHRYPNVIRFLFNKIIQEINGNRLQHLGIFFIGIPCGFLANVP